METPPKKINKSNETAIKNDRVRLVKQGDTDHSAKAIDPKSNDSTDRTCLPSSLNYQGLQQEIATALPSTFAKNTSPQELEYIEELDNSPVSPVMEVTASHPKKQPVDPLLEVIQELIEHKTNKIEYLEGEITNLERASKSYEDLLAKIPTLPQRLGIQSDLLGNVRIKIHRFEEENLRNKTDLKSLKRIQKNIVELKKENKEIELKFEEQKNALLKAIDVKEQLESKVKKLEENLEKKEAECQRINIEFEGNLTQEIINVENELRAKLKYDLQKVFLELDHIFNLPDPTEIAPTLRKGMDKLKNLLKKHGIDVKEGEA